MVGALEMYKNHATWASARSHPISDIAERDYEIVGKMLALFFDDPNSVSVSLVINKSLDNLVTPNFSRYLENQVFRSGLAECDR